MDYNLSDSAKKIISYMGERNVSLYEEALPLTIISEGVFLLPRSANGVLGSLVKKDLILKTDNAPREYFLSEKGLNLYKSTKVKM